MVPPQKEDISAREWMPSVDTFFGSGDLPVLNVLPPEGEEGERQEGSHMMTPNAIDLEQIDSAMNVCSFFGRGCHAKQSDKEDEGDTTDTTTDNEGSIQTSSADADFEDDKTENSEKDHCSTEETQDLLGGEVRRRRDSKFMVYDALRRTWETQRDVLLQRLEEKDVIIQRQSKNLKLQTDRLAKMEASIDGLESHLLSECGAYRVGLKQFEQRMMKETASLSTRGDEIERTQRKMKRHLSNILQSVPKEIQSLESALSYRTLQYSRSEQEKQDVIQKLDSSNQEVERLRGKVLSLAEKLKKAESAESVESVSATSIKAPGADVDRSVHSSIRENDEIDDVRKENVALKRELIEMQENLIDLKEHAAELESQMDQGKRAFMHALDQKAELEVLRTAKKNSDLLLALRQKTINGLTQTLFRLQSEMNQSSMVPTESVVFEELLQSHQRTDEIEKMYIESLTEKESCTKEIQRLNGVVRCMDDKAKEQTRRLSKLQRESGELKKALNCKNSEIATLQTNLRVESVVRSSSRRDQSTDRDADSGVIRELLKSKVALAELNEVVIELRHEVASFKNNSSSSKHVTSQFRKIVTAVTGITS